MNNSFSNLLNEYNKAKFEESLEAFKQMGALLFAYNSAMIESGFDKKAALELTKEFQTNTLNPVSYTHLDVYKRQVRLAAEERQPMHDLLALTPPTLAQALSLIHI